jgi:hypothetical protein
MPAVAVAEAVASAQVAVVAEPRCEPAAREVDLRMPARAAPMSPIQSHDPALATDPASATDPAGAAIRAGLIDQATVGALLLWLGQDWRMQAPMAMATTVATMRRTEMEPRSLTAHAGSVHTTRQARRILPTMAAAFVARKTQRATLS